MRINLSALAVLSCVAFADPVVADTMAGEVAQIFASGTGSINFR